MRIGAAGIYRLVQGASEVRTMPFDLSLENIDLV
jgi:hypothetical protein